MSQPTPQERRQQRGQEESKRRRQAVVRTRLVFVGSIIVVLLVVAVVGYVLVRQGGSGIPTGTQLFAEPDKTHTTGPVHYDRVPPAGGAHNAVWLSCGIYDQPVPNENAVHSLEHGAVWITYQPSLPSSELATLRQVVSSHYVGSQRYLILSPSSGLSAPIVASAWGAQLPLQTAGDPRLVAFIQHFAGGSQGGEPGASCTGGTGMPIGENRHGLAFALESSIDPGRPADVNRSSQSVPLTIVRAGIIIHFKNLEECPTWRTGGTSGGPRNPAGEDRGGAGSF